MTAADEQELIVPLDPGRRLSMKRIVSQVFGPFPSYEDARAEAHTACRRLGLLFGRPGDNRQLEIGDMVRTAYVGGWEACESRLVSPDMADAIAHAIDLPSAVLERRPGESDRQLRVRAIQQVIAYGLAKR